MPAINQGGETPPLQAARCRRFAVIVQNKTKKNRRREHLPGAGFYLVRKRLDQQS